MRPAEVACAVVQTPRRANAPRASYARGLAKFRGRRRLACTRTRSPTARSAGGATIVNRTLPQIRSGSCPGRSYDRAHADAFVDRARWIHELRLDPELGRLAVLGEETVVRGGSSAREAVHRPSVAAARQLEGTRSLRSRFGSTPSAQHAVDQQRGTRPRAGARPKAAGRRETRARSGSPQRLRTSRAETPEDGGVTVSVRLEWLQHQSLLADAAAVSAIAASF